MQLVGATAAFIRLPLVIEGILYGAVGALLAGGIVLFIRWQIEQYTMKFETPLTSAVPSPAFSHRDARYPRPRRCRGRSRGERALDPAILKRV